MTSGAKSFRKAISNIKVNTARPNPPSNCKTSFSESVQVPGYKYVRVEYHPESGGKFHIQYKGNKGPEQYQEIQSKSDLQKLPKAVRNSSKVQKAINKGWSKGC